MKKDDLGEACWHRKEKLNTYNVLVWKSKDKYCLEILEVDGKIILKWIWRKLDGGCGLNSSGSG
jgi:hypothetical protein